MIAALYDIHGNLPALEAVLEEVGTAGADLIVVGGDVLPGPMASEALDLLRTLQTPVTFIQGNGDRDVLAFARGEGSPRVAEQYRDVMRWNAERLRPDQLSAVAEWPATLRVPATGIGDVLFCHATPRDDNEIFTSETPEDRLRPIFDAAGAAVVVCGHTHVQFDRAIGATRVINAGSVGMPFGDTGADWLLIGGGVEFRHTRYHLASAAARITATAYPGARQFAERYVLTAPSKREMLDAFARVALK